jgi:hypothetical protein
VRNDPFNRQFIVDRFPIGFAVGDVYRFKIRAFNMQGYTDSDKSPPLVLASVPDAPLVGPISDPAVTNGK